MKQLISVSLPDTLRLGELLLEIRDGSLEIVIFDDKLGYYKKMKEEDSERIIEYLKELVKE